MFEAILGIDVGSTFMDFVVLRGGQLIAKAKIPTTTDITLGIISGIQEVLNTAKLSAHLVNYVMIGTTHLLNATLEHRLNKVAAIRLGFPATTAIPPFTDWPSELAKNVASLTYIINGGYEYNGQPISEIDYAQLNKIVDDLIEHNIHLVAITGVFAHINPEQEIQVATYLKEKLPHLKISLSHQMGGLGLLERENATILNSSLIPLYMQVCNGIHHELLQAGLINAKIYLSHNDGTAEEINHFNKDSIEQIKPVLTLNAGPANSMKGAAVIAEMLGLDDTLIVDIGCCTSDKGIYIEKSLIEVNTVSKIAGISFNFSTIKTHSTALGGGSIINQGKQFSITGTSVRNKLLQDAICFGGNVLTPTDIAVYKKRIILKDTQKQVMQYPDEETMNFIDDLMHQKLAYDILEFWSSSEERSSNLLLIGGGSKLFDQKKLAHLLNGKINNIFIPDNAEIANALGATQGEISVSYSEVVDYQKIPRDVAKQNVIEKAIAKAKINGALYDIKIKYINEREIQYLIGKPTELMVKVSGRICVNKIKIIENSISNTKNALDQHKKKGELFGFNPNKSKGFNENLEKYNEFSLVDQKLLKKDVSIINSAIGCAFLGSGGGGDTRLSELMLKEALKRHNSINCIPLNSLGDDATVVCFAMMGSPSILEEKIPSKEEMLQTILAIENHLKKKIDAIITTEIGGANGLLTMIVAAESGKLLPDADCMGRALPCLHMVTPIMNNKISDFVAILCSAKETRKINAKDAFELETIARRFIVEMGGSACLSYMPMTGKTAKEVCIPNTLTIAEKIGELFNFAKDKGFHPFTIINQYLEKTEYEKIEEVFDGRIEDLRRIEEDGFSVGGAMIVSDSNQIATLVFQNENLQLTTSLPNGYKKQLAIVPNIITVVDYDSLLPISCGQLKFGQKVRIVTMKSPRYLLSAAAYDIVGPKAYDLNKLSHLIEKNFTHPNNLVIRTHFKENEEAIQ